MAISDQTGKQWVTVFNDQALPLLDNKTADELYQMKDSGQVRRRREEEEERMHFHVHVILPGTDMMR